MAYQGSFKLKGATTAGGGAISASNFSRAHFVRIQTQAATNTVTVVDSDDVAIGTCILVTAGDSIVIEKSPGDKVSTSGNAVGSAVARTG